MALFWRIWAAVTAISLTVISIFVGLATIQFNNINSHLLGERLVVLADRTAEPFQAAARLGLALSTVRNASALLERARQSDEQIHAIHVFDSAGRIVHSTVSPAPETVAPETLAARASASGGPWHRETAERFFTGVDVVSPHGRSVGGIIVAYPLQGSVTRVKAMAAELSLAGVAALLISAAAGVVLLGFSLRAQIRLFESIDNAITRFEQRAWRSTAGRSPAAGQPGADELGRLLEEAETRYRAVGRALATEAKRTR